MVINKTNDELYAHLGFYGDLYNVVIHLCDNFNDKFGMEVFICDWKNEKDYTLGEFLDTLE